MSYLDKLLEGVVVEWKTLGEISEIYGGLSGKSKADFENGNAKYISYKNIFFNLNVKYNILESVKISETENQHEVKTGDVLFTGSSETADEVGMSSSVTTNIDEPVYLNSFSFGVRFNEEIQLIPEFSKYLFRSKFMRTEISKTASGVTRYNVSKSRFKKLQIPIPPIDVQKEIVRILDTFTELTAELKAELKARKKQYNYYREALLSFEEGAVEWKTLGELFDLKNGYTPSKSNIEYWKDGSIPWFRMEDIRQNGRLLGDAIQKVSKSAIKGNKLFKENSIIISTSATIGEYALITIPFLCNQRFTSLSLKNEFKNILEIKFLFYYSFVIGEWCKNNVTIGNFAGVDMGGFKKIKIPIPPLAEQERIVTILDKFDTLTTSIIDGLPKEIELRKKQYEYYRDLLLTFPKKETA